MTPMLSLLALWLLQASPDAPLLDVSATLQPMRIELQQNNATFGVTTAMTTAKHRLRDWVEGRLARASNDADVRALYTEFHDGLRRARLLCDDCERNVLG